MDYRALNKVMIRDNSPLPLIEDQLDALEGKKYFSVLDLKDGFHHVRVSEESVKYTPFIAPQGLFEFLKMPFGLKVAPNVFQSYINQVLSKFIRNGDLVAFMDDFLVTTETLEYHVQILKEILSVLVENCLELRLDKCKFLLTEVDYLGYYVTQNGIGPTKRGIEAISKYPIPKTVRGVQRFLGMCSYFRKSIEGFSVIAKPLYDLVKKDATFCFENRDRGVRKIKTKTYRSTDFESIQSVSRDRVTLRRKCSWIRSRPPAAQG